MLSVVRVHLRLLPFPVSISLFVGEMIKMSVSPRLDLASMTIAAIRQFCRDYEIAGHSRYTKKADLIAYVDSVLDSIDEFSEDESTEAPTSTDAIASNEIHPDAIASNEIYPDLPRSTHRGSNIPAVPKIRMQNDLHKGSHGILGAMI